MVLNADGTFTYIPNTDYSGTETILYEACDGTGLCEQNVLTIVVLPINDTPDAVFDTYSTDVNTAINGDVSANDSDNDGVGVNISLVSDVSNGVLTLNGDGTFVYVPNTDFTGEDTFEYSYCDNAGACDTAVVTLVVINPNSPPVPGDDEFVVDEDSTLDGNVLTNDTDPEGGALSVSLLVDVTNGTLTVNSDGSFTYVPNADFNGTDQFIYVVCDPNDACAEGVVVIVVLPVNDAPIAIDDIYLGEEDSFVDGNVSPNDSDIDDTDLTYALDTAPANGSVVINADGSFTYVPNADFFGTDTFTYTVCDTSNVCDVGLVTITIDGLNDSPIAVDDAYQVEEDGVLTGNVGDNDSDVDGSNPIWVVETSTTSGTLELTGDGAFTYTPGTGFEGTDVFTYILCDGEGDCDTAVVVITVIGMDTSPVAVDDNAVVNEDGALLYDVASNDNDLDGDDLSFTVLEGLGAGEGTLTMDENGVITYIPPADFNGTVDFTYTACDPDNNCDTATVTIVVLPVNDAPIGVDDVYTINQDTTLDNDVSDNDSDIDDTNLVYDQESDVSSGTLTFNPDGTFTYVPNPGFFGVDSFTYTVCDGEDCDTVTVTINVIEVIIDPQLGNDEYSTPEDESVSGDVSANDIATDGFVYSVNDGPNNGTVTMNPDGTFTYTPNSGFVGTDTFTYTACNDEGDCYEAVVTIIVYNVPGPSDKVISIPAGFSPNADQVGDTFIIENIDQYPNNELIIFNRWGNQVFDASPYTNSNAWDGTTQSDGLVVGSKVPEGTYFYVLDKGDGSEKLSGFIVIKYESK